ncbi:recombinase family protein [Nocardia terpenica]|uniref:recombinase family protein n=1 Tax=Nocardia terpenica TaxID=455432 RepID=UPI0018956DBB|nr:recombinase family protein [Nocardia terpenica]MBF6062986.1 recombinase family protein [Nocardia terpenica]MBF6104879.1 recombinase family protein [Nocardia terpenica]MBF6112684.1 recombinase family protein [Nocardia terpenica]MBF6118607.1 recombinase family protein [Nocardia terpenica]MBF6155086.1 recombinase family protein [Nocardia terpenica]
MTKARTTDHEDNPADEANPDLRLTARERRALVERLRQALVRTPCDALPLGRLRIAIYCRISSDRTGRGVGVERQLQDNRKEAAALAGVVVGIYIDNDVSAYSGKPRPEYQKLLADIEAGWIDVVITWHPDRLHRSPAELEHFLPIMEQTKCTVHTVTAGHWDLSTPSGRAVARTMGTWAYYESEHKAERIKRQKEQAASQGLFLGGPRRFGFEADGYTLRPDEAVVIREAVRALIGGIKLRPIVTDLNARRIPTARGGKLWCSRTLKHILLSPRIAGLTPFHGGALGKARWNPIVSEDEWRAVVAILSHPDRGQNNSGAPISWLGSGLYVCGGCQADTMRANNGPRNRKVYQCQTYFKPIAKPERSRHVTRTAHRVDEVVELTVVERLANSDLLEVIAQRNSGTDAKDLHLELSGANARLEELSNLFANGHVTAAQLAAGSQTLRNRVGEIERQLAEVAQLGPLAELGSVDNVHRYWFGSRPDRSDGLSLMKRRAIVDELATVTVQPTYRGARFNPELIEIDWKVAA